MKFQVLFTLMLLSHVYGDQITWQLDRFGYTANACDFKGNDFKNVVITSTSCGQKCSNTVGCTHYVWSTWNSGTCWLKTSTKTITQSNAFYTNDFTMVCGILSVETSSNRVLFWSDDFNVNGNVNTSNWKFEIGNGVNGWGNSELEYYTNSNAFVKNGALTIEARKENIGSFKYTSSRLVSTQAFKYGIFEARIKLPKGAGSWPAFWLLSSKKPLNWPADGELGIMEHVGRDPGGINFNIHCGAYSAATRNNRGNYVKLDDPYSDFHLYTLDWNVDRIKFMLDNIVYFTYYKHSSPTLTWPFDGKFNIILNLAIGGYFAGTVDDSIFPTQLIIDYVRVYQPSTQTFPQFTIKSLANNLYVAAENAGNSSLIANRQSASGWETFKLIPNLDGSFSFLAMANGYFVSADNYGKNALIANRLLNQQWENFILTPNSDGSFTIESQANWKFVCAEDGGKSPLIANRVATSRWESFNLNINPFPTITTTSNPTVQYWQSDPVSGKMFLQMPSLSFKIDNKTPINPYTIFINDNIKYQQMDGFGASLTDSSTWLLSNKLTSNKRNQILNDLFTLNGIGIGISLLRQTIGSSDFAWEKWSFDDTPNNQDDLNLNSFSLWREEAYIRPMLNLALAASKGRVKIFASPWSPPAWMKTQKNLDGNLGGTLRTDVYKTYANYFVKYIQSSQAKGNDIYAITVQNEPLYPASKYPGMNMSHQEQSNFIGNFLGPALASAGIKTKIVAFDHNFDNTYYAISVCADKNAQKFVSGAGFHHFGGTESDILAFKTQHSAKEMWITEAGFGTWVGGYLQQFQYPITLMIRTSRHWSKGLIMWNVALDQNGGPNVFYGGNIVNRGLLQIRSDQIDSVNYEPGFYALGHFSKFVDPNAFRINSNTFNNDIENVAFKNPDNSIVVIVSSQTNTTRNVRVQWKNKWFEALIPGFGAATFKFPGV